MKSKFFSFSFTPSRWLLCMLISSSCFPPSSLSLFYPPFFFYTKRLEVEKDFFPFFFFYQNTSTLFYAGNMQVHASNWLYAIFSLISFVLKQWHALSREEQAKYYELARKERQLHMQLYPGWSARDNYVSINRTDLQRCACVCVCWFMLFVYVSVAWLVL